MTQETYHVEREGVDKDDKKEDEYRKKKSVAFKASSSSLVALVSHCKFLRIYDAHLVYVYYLT